MWYIVLFCVLIVIAIISYFLFERDVLSITFISSSVYALSTLAAYISYKLEDSWNYVELDKNTAIYVIISIVCIAIGEFVVRLIQRKTKRKSKEKNINSIEIIKVSNIKILICTLFIALAFILIYANMCKITHTTGFSKVINAYKVNSAMYNDSEDTANIKFLYIQMYRVSTVIGIIFLYIYINNMCFNKKLKYNFRFIIPIIASCILSMLLGGRSAIMRFIVAGIIFSIIIYEKKKKINLIKFLLIGILLLSAILPLFYNLLSIIGQSTKNNFANYITFYLGSPLPCFNEYIENTNQQKVEQKHFGENTFIGIQQILYKFHIIDYYNIYQGEWVDFGNGLKSNVFTGIKTYLEDFGIMGVIVFQILFGIVFSYLYLKARNGNYKFLIFYGLIALNVIDQFRSEKIFSSLIRIDTIVYIVSIIFLTWFLFNLRIGRKVKLLNASTQTETEQFNSLKKGI